MPDWLLDIVHALPDAAAWRLVFRIFALGAAEEGWQYGVTALAMLLLLHVVLRRLLSSRLIAKWPKASDLRREITYSTATVAILAACNVLIVALELTKSVDVYSRPLEHGVVWLVLSLPALIIWQDFHFYWTHRLLHTRWLFRHVHAVHHRSRHPSPFAAFSFHPFEALNNSAMLLIALLVVPVNDVVLGLFIVHQVVRSTHGHAAVETMPRGFARHPFWGRFITTTHHHLHHEIPRCNFGLWFTWWDRLCGTEHATYFERFDEVTHRPSVREDQPAQQLELGKP